MTDPEPLVELREVLLKVKAAIDESLRLLDESVRREEDDERRD